MLLATVGIGGCVSDDRARAAATPNSATPRVLTTVTSSFADTDGDRYRDATRAVVYVFADPSYPVPMRAEGEFDFILESPGGKRFTQWHFDRLQTRAALRQLAPGPGFVFDLAIDPARSIDEPEAELRVTFTPVKGEPIHGQPKAALLVGPLSRQAR